SASAEQIPYSTGRVSPSSTVPHSLVRKLPARPMGPDGALSTSRNLEPGATPIELRHARDYGHEVALGVEGGPCAWLSIRPQGPCGSEGRHLDHRRDCGHCSGNARGRGPPGGQEA